MDDFCCQHWWSPGPVPRSQLCVHCRGPVHCDLLRTAVITMKIIFILLLSAIIGSWSGPQTPSTTRTSTIARSTSVKATKSTIASSTRMTTTKSTTKPTTRYATTTKTTKRPTTTTKTTKISTTSTTTKSTTTPSTATTTFGRNGIHDYAVLLGGQELVVDGTVIDYVNPNVQVWYRGTLSPCQTPPSMPNLPEIVYGSAAAVLGNMLINCGGRKILQSYNSANENGITNACYSYTVGSAGAAWVSAPAMVKRRQLHTMTAVNNKIVVTGGLGWNPQSVSTVEIFTSGGWQEMLGWNMTINRADHCAVKYGGNNVVVTGGLVWPTTISNTVEHLNTVTGTWTTMASMNQARIQHSCLSYEEGATEYIVVAGGSNGADVLSTVEQFSSATNVWVLLTSMNSPRSGHSMGRFGYRYITVIGGRSGRNQNYVILNDTEYLDGTVWKYGKNLQFRRTEYAMARLPCVEHM